MARGTKERDDDTMAKARNRAATEQYENGRIETRFEGISMRLASEDKKTTALSFSVILSEELAEQLPRPILTNFKHIRKVDVQAGEIDIEAGAIPAQNWSFFQWPEKGAVQHRLDSVGPEKVSLVKDKKTGTVAWHFTLTTDLTKDVWEFMKQFGNTIWFSFEESQQELPLDEKSKAAGVD